VRHRGPNREQRGQPTLRTYSRGRTREGNLPEFRPNPNFAHPWGTQNQQREFPDN
jgi:hypothetical protein